MTELRVRPEAELDAFEAAVWYESERLGLGSAFLEAMHNVFRRIISINAAAIPERFERRSACDHGPVPVRSIFLCRGRYRHRDRGNAPSPRACYVGAAALVGTLPNMVLQRTIAAEHRIVGQTAMRFFFSGEVDTLISDTWRRTRQSVEGRLRVAY